MDTDTQLVDAGKRVAYWRIIHECIKGLSLAGELTDTLRMHQLQWVEERAETIAKLRELCAEYGDNDWPDDLYLPDVVEQHLGRLP